MNFDNCRQGIYIKLCLRMWNYKHSSPAAKSKMFSCTLQTLMCVVSWGHTIRSAARCQSVSGTNTCFSDAAVPEVTKHAFPVTEVLTFRATNKTNLFTHLDRRKPHKAAKYKHVANLVKNVFKLFVVTTFFVSLLSDRYVRTDTVQNKSGKLPSLTWADSSQ